ncbi:hypothetical protein J6590_104049 [Homalodisca vitripennis]|nr:hypothetical protein J6590_104049 [Homalodisca vitripennis]
MGNGRLFGVSNNGGHNWVYYVVYFMIAVLITWGALFVMLRTELIPRDSWMYRNTKWVPGLGQDSWARPRADPSPALAGLEDFDLESLLRDPEYPTKLLESGDPTITNDYDPDYAIKLLESREPTTTNEKHDVGNLPDKQRRKKRESTSEDKKYRSDREYVKRRSHEKMIWYLRQVGVRHPAAIRTHLEKVKHQEFELANLQCVYPHSGLALENGEMGTAASYYNIYCATPGLVEHVRNITGHHDPGENRRVVVFIADLVGRMLWHHSRIHAVMFAKSDHYKRDCFLLYSRQAEPTPCMMRSDAYFCRRHDSEKFKSFAPQPDLTRVGSNRMANESSIYVIGRNISELWEDYPFEYRNTQCRAMKALFGVIERIDPLVMEQSFSAVNKYINGGRENSLYSEIASRTDFDVQSVLLRDTGVRSFIADDSPVYRDYVERFITMGLLNVHSMLKTCHESRVLITNSVKRLDSITLHHVRYRKEIRSLRTNRVFYYRNADDFICSLSALDDAFENRASVVNSETSRRPVYFYDVLHPFNYDCNTDVNRLVMTEWSEVTNMITESSYTIGRRLTPELLRGKLPEDPFYPSDNMSPTDIAIDRMLERAMKHSKKLQPVTEDVCSKPRSDSTSRIWSSLSKTGENRLKDGYRSPPYDSYEKLVEVNGETIPVQITVGGDPKMVAVNYGPKPSLAVEPKPVCVYLIDPNKTVQINIIPGSRIVDKTRKDYVLLTATDRIVRVFTIQSVTETYVVKPYAYFVFRNMPICSVDSSLLGEMYRSAKSFNGVDGSRVFGEFPTTGAAVIPR